MDRTYLRCRLAVVTAAILGLELTVGIARAGAQIPTQVQPGQQLPSQDQAEDLLRNRPDLVEQLRQRLAASGLTPDQIRSRLRAAGYSETLLDAYMSGTDTTSVTRPGPQTFDAARALGILSDTEADSLAAQDSTRTISDSLRQVLDSLQLVRADSARADSLADSVRVLQGRGLKLFGLETFRRTSTRFQASQAGPVDDNYRLGSGDLLVLILTGDVEQVYSLDVNREGFIVIPKIGAVYVANLTLGQLNSVLTNRLSRVYSGIRRGTHQVPGLGGPAPQHSGVRRRRRGAARSLPDLRCRHRTHRALLGRRPHQQRQLSEDRSPPVRQAGGLARSLRLPAARHQCR